jgi:hypothetical protein
MTTCLLCARGLVSGITFEDASISTSFLDRDTKDPTFYVDVKSEELRDVLREVLKDVHGISLSEEKPKVSPISNSREWTATNRA